MKSKSSSSTSTIIEYFRMSHVNFDKMDYGHSLQWNFTTQMNLQACIGLPSRCGSNPTSSKAAAAAAATAAAILCQCIRGQSPTAEKKCLRTDRIWTMSPAEDIVQDSHLQVCLLRDVTAKKRDQCGMCSQCHERVSVQNPKCKDWLRCLHRRNSNL